MNPVLAKGNQLRIDRAVEKREIQALGFVEGRQRVAELIEDPSEVWEGARLSYVLRIPSRSGQHFVSRIVESLAVAGVPTASDYRLRDLTDRQRRCLVTAINRYGRKK